jgi:hypothetical protein
MHASYMRWTRWVWFLLLPVSGAWQKGVCAQASPLPAQAHIWRSIPDWYPFDTEKYAGGVVPASIEQTEMRICAGDGPLWGSRSWDDSGWAVEENRYSVLHKDRGIFWVRLWVRSRGDIESLPALVSLVETASSEVYWDGVLVHTSGTPGIDREHEVPGPLSSLFEIPRSLLGPGTHLIALRMSTYHYNRPDTPQRVVVLNVRADLMASANERRRLYPAMAVGAMLVTGLFVLVMWLVAARQPSLLAFSGLCLGGAALVAINLWRYVYPFRYSWSYAIWFATDAVSILAAGCMVYFVVSQFRVPRRKWILVAFVAGEGALAWRNGPVPFGVAAAAFRLDTWTYAFLVAMACSAWTAWRMRSAIASIVSACLALSLYLYARDPVNFARTHLLATLLPCLLGFILALATMVRRERRETHEARLTAARLEIDLLKKSLQPHFLMNTLTTLAQIVEEEPRVAVKLIDDLALEFRALAAIAGLKQIPLSRELELCETHLRVMTVRTEKPWRLEVSGVDSSVGVPPALFLTLIENAFSHQRALDGATTFSLRAEAERGRTRYTFVAPGIVNHASEGRQGGMGLRYVRVRLEEGWPGKWTLSQREVLGGWETVIDLGGSDSAAAPIP